MSGRPASERVIPGKNAISVGNPCTKLKSGWAWTPLSDLAELGTGHTPSRQFPEYWDGDVPWIGLRDANRHHGRVIEDTEQHVTELGLANSAARWLPKDTVCLSRTASVGYVVKMARPMATSQDFVTWSCGDALDPDYLMLALLAEGSDIRRFGNGSTHTTIYFPEVKAFHIALPPLPEQRRIVAKLDALDASSKRARADLDRIPALVARAKQAIMGEIIAMATEDARRRPFGELMSHLTSGSRDWATYYDRGESVFVLAGNIRPLRFDPSPKRFVDPPLDGRDAQRSKIQKNDLLLTIVGAGTGDICWVSDEHENYFVCQSVALLRLSDPSVASFYAYWFNSEKHGRGDFNEAMYGAARPHLSFEQIRAFEVPIVDSEQAGEIVRRIESAFAKIDRMAAEAASASKILDRLDQALLAKAFRGELVPQDPDDEPASVLLERIKASPVAAPRRTRGRNAAATE
ncbi:type I restriction enzyme S subunit [Rhodoblastus acidophilus]|uniref:restriction endonuclease subunit S n=1 Tax=Rhodoblastus acidophilus TaxID=1074 RepID=UPI002224C70C|nr:restriction endonuclease subunit S [Rhodoblastus acidophilus]MCW2283165.1 type I restriction enzyme S subunit [Rhodoblastus acidophilus]MCW2332026.1 type I restriction enzyme S subunit [Rhodoblastus acidophilus]